MTSTYRGEKRFQRTLRQNVYIASHEFSILHGIRAPVGVITITHMTDIENAIQVVNPLNIRINDTEPLAEEGNQVDLDLFTSDKMIIFLHHFLISSRNLAIDQP